MTVAHKDRQKELFQSSANPGPIKLYFSFIGSLCWFRASTPVDSPYFFLLYLLLQLLRRTLIVCPAGTRRVHSIACSGRCILRAWGFVDFSFFSGLQRASANFSRLVLCWIGELVAASVQGPDGQKVDMDMGIMKCKSQ